MKHICFVASAFHRDDVLIVHRQGIFLVKAGYKVSYVTCDTLPDENRNGIIYRSTGRRAKNIIDRIFGNNKRLKKYLRTYPADIYQISEPELIPLGLHLKRKGYKVVFNLREYYPDYYSRKKAIPKVLKPWLYKFIELYFRRTMKKYDALFNCMPEMTDYIRKVMPCRYFVDVANFPIVNRDFYLSYEDYCKRGDVINYFGSIYTISCQKEMLDALIDFPNVKYLLAGIFYNQDYYEQLKVHESWKQVEFINGFPREELANIIGRSSIGNVLRDFNKTETPQGSMSVIKIYETMEACVPIISPRVQLYEDMIKKYNCGICVDPHNVDEIKAAIETLTTNKEMAYLMGQNGRKAVLEEYSWDKEFEKYEDTITKIINEQIGI